MKEIIILEGAHGEEIHLELSDGQRDYGTLSWLDALYMIIGLEWLFIFHQVIWRVG